MSRTLSTAVSAALVAGLLLVVCAPLATASSTTAGVSVDVPSTAVPGLTLTVTVRLPAGVAAVDGRVLFQRSAAELLGVAPLGGGTAFMPVVINGGAAFGAYGLTSTATATVLRLVLVPHQAGQLQLRVVIDAAADRLGQRLSLTDTEHAASVGVSDSAIVRPAPASTGHPTPTASAGPLRALDATGRIDKRDLDIARADWETQRALGATCGAGLAADANGDGCVDIVDVQAILAHQGLSVAGGASISGTSISAANPVPQTYTVTSTADTPDANPGDGTCADSQGRCTLRAAMTSADYHGGFDTIAFRLPGTAPVTIQLTSALPIITSMSGGVLIDGYTQPGSSVNTQTFGSNAIPGVELRGNGPGASEVGIRITSANNTIRGMAIDNVWRGLYLDGSNAHGNRIVGNWFGFARDGSLAAAGQYGILINTGANHNFIGSAAPGDRNVDGNWTTAIDNYGTGVEANTIQGNLLCIRPGGGSTGGGSATCGTGIDHNFGPKDSVIGGPGAGEGNVIGPTTLQGIEFSHGWNPADHTSTTTWQINGHQVIGNWVGFRADGRYDVNYRSGLNFSNSDNGQGINVYDGVYDNLVKGNYIAAAYDGIQLSSPIAQRNTVEGNTIGVSPQGQTAPLGRWGIVVRWGTKYDVILGNTIRNAAAGGIGLITTNNTGTATSPAYNITISQNIITDTSGPAIYLQPAQSDPTQGANALVAAPVVTSATTTRVRGTATAGATVEVYRASRPAGQAGLPTAYLGSALAASDRTWSLALTLAATDLVTALQIRSDKNTSGLASNVAVGGAPPPASGDLIASDDFQRSVSAGWGTATLGGNWALTGPAADFSVTGGTGHISVVAGQSREARLAVGTADVSVTGRVTFDRLPAAGNDYVYLLARANGTTAYRAAIRVAPNGAVFVQLKRAINGAESNIAGEVPVAGLTASAGSQLAFRFDVVGTQLKLRVWDAAGADPGTWQTTATDSTAGLAVAGAAGLRVYVGANVPNGPVTFSFDGIEIRKG